MNKIEQLEMNFDDTTREADNNTMNNTKTHVTIMDRGCGTGKSEGFVRGLRYGQNVLYIVPYLNDVWEFYGKLKRHECDIPFYSPVTSEELEELGGAIPVPEDAEGLNHDDPKWKQLLWLCSRGHNIVTTHALYDRLSYVVENGYLDDYDIYIDEVPEPVEVTWADEDAKEAIQEFLLDLELIEVEEDGRVSPTEKWLNKPGYYTRQLAKVRTLSLLEKAKSGCLYLHDSRMFLTCMPKCLLEAGQSITIFTYMSEGSFILPYLSKIGVEYTINKTPEKEERLYRAKIKKLLGDVQTFATGNRKAGEADADKVNLGYASQANLQRDGFKGIATALQNMRSRNPLWSDIEPEETIISCRKTNWFGDGSGKSQWELDEDGLIVAVTAEKPGQKAGVFQKGSRLGKAHWLGQRTRGTNAFRKCRAAIYLNRLNPNQSLVSFLDHGGHVEEYRVTELIQWMFRTKIRDSIHKDLDDIDPVEDGIVLCLPDKFMRKALADYLDCKGKFAI